MGRANDWNRDRPDISRREIVIQLNCPVQRSQALISILNTLLSRCIQVIATWRSAGVLSNQFTQVG
jgi:hypothetical protein